MPFEVSYKDFISDEFYMSFTSLSFFDSVKSRFCEIFDNFVNFLKQFMRIFVSFRSFSLIFYECFGNLVIF